MAVSPSVEQFQRSAAFTKRVNSNVNRVRDAAKQLARCSQRKLYFYTESDAAVIVAELRKAADDVEGAFRRAGETETSGALWDITTARHAHEARL